jgi:predicted ester cyclase
VRLKNETKVRKQTLRALQNLYCRGDLDAAEDLFAAEYVDHDPDGPSAARGPKSVRRFLQTYRSAFPDLRLAVRDEVVEGDTVLIRWRGRGTHLGPLLESAPTGRRVALEGVTVLRFAESRAVEGWSKWEVPGPAR